jgi:hypothetical protein
MNTTTGWYAEQSKLNPDLFRVIFDFNRRPQFWVHPSVLASLPHAPVVTALATSHYGARHLSIWLAQQLGLNAAEDCWDFQEPRRRLILLSHTTLERLARFCGAALHWPRIASVIGRSDIQELKGTLGEDAHSFAMRRGRMVIQEDEAAKAGSSTASLATRCLQAGWELVITALANDPESLRQRLKLKLPSGDLATPVGDVSPETRERAWQHIRKIGPDVFSEGELKCFA